MRKRIFPVGSSGFIFFQNLLSKIQEETVNRRENIIYLLITLIPYLYYVERNVMIPQFLYFDWTSFLIHWGTIILIYGALSLLWHQYPMFSMFRAVRVDSQSNFILLFVIITAVLGLFSMQIFALSLIYLVLYLLYRSQKLKTVLLSLLLLIIVFIIGIQNVNPILSSTVLVSFPVLIWYLLFKKESTMITFRKALALFLILFVSSKEFSAGIFFMFYWFILSQYAYFVRNEKFRWLEFD